MTRSILKSMKRKSSGSRKSWPNMMLLNQPRRIETRRKVRNPIRRDPGRNLKIRLSKRKKIVEIK